MAKNQPAFGYLYISPGVTGEYCKLLEKNTLFGPPLVNCELHEVPLFDGTILTQNATNYVTDNNIYDASVHFGAGGPVSIYSLQGHPSWLQIVSSTGILFGTPDASGDTAGITVVGANAAGSAVSNPFTMSVAANPPIFTGTIPNYQFEEGLTIPPTDLSGYFQAGGPVLTYSLQNAPAWLNIDPATGIVSGTPNTGDDYINVTVSGTNGDGTAVSNTFDINVTDILPAPEFTGSIPNITGYIGLPIEAYDASVDFSGQVGSYSLIGNPAWLQINPSTGLLTGTPDVLGTHNNIRVRATNAAGSADSNLFSTTVSEILPIFSRDYTGVDIGADAFPSRISTGLLLRHDGSLMYLPEMALRLWKSRTVFNLMGDTNNYNTTPAFVSSESLIGWNALVGATIDPDNVTFNFGPNQGSRIDMVANYIGDSVNYLNGRTLVYVLWLSAATPMTIRLRHFQEGAVNTNTYQDINLTTVETPFAFTITLQNDLVNGVRMLISNEAVGGEKTGIRFHKMQFEDVTGRPDQNPSEYVSYGIESDPYHGLGVDSVEAFPFDLVSSVNPSTYVVSYGVGSTPIVSDGILFEPTAANRVNNSKFDVLGSGADVFQYWAETINGTSTVNQEIVDTPPGIRTACRFDLDGAASNTFITANPISYLTVTDQVDRIFLSLYNKQDLTSDKLQARLLCDNGAGGLTQSWNGIAWTDSIVNFVIPTGNTWQKTIVPILPTNAGRTRVWLNSMRRGGNSANHSLYFTGVQLEKVCPTSLIRTEGVAVFREKDQLLYFPSPLSQPEGAVVMQTQFGIDYTDRPDGTHWMLNFDRDSGPIYDRNTPPEQIAAWDSTTVSAVDVSYQKDKVYLFATRWGPSGFQIGFRNVTDGGTWVWDTEKPYDGSWPDDDVLEYFWNIAYPYTLSKVDIYDTDPGTGYIEGTY